MNVVYTDLELEDLCALEFLGNKYEGRSEEFAIVAKSNGMFSKDSVAEKAVRKIFPNCFFAYQDTWNVSEYKDTIKRIYCMSDLTALARDLEIIGSCSQIYVLAGETHGLDGWRGYLTNEDDIANYKYVISKMSKFSMQVTYPETKSRFTILRFSGIQKLKYFEEYQKEFGEYCPKLQFILQIESKQGFMLHLFSEYSFMRKDSTKTILEQERLNRYKEYFYAYKQRCQVYNSICLALEKLQYNNDYVQLDYSDKIRVNAAAFMFIYTNGLQVAQRITISEKLFDSWGLQVFTPYVDWVLQHIDDFMYLKSGTDVKELKIILWKNNHYCDQSIPRHVYQSIATFKTTGLFPCINGYAMTLEEYNQWQDHIYDVKNKPSELMYKSLFMLMCAEINCCNDVKKDNKNIFTRDFAFRHIKDLEENVLTAFKEMNDSMESNVFA